MEGYSFTEEQLQTDQEIGSGGIAEAVCNAILPYADKQNAWMPIMGESMASADQLNALLLSANPQAPDYLHLAEIFLEEGRKEGVRGDGAFLPG